MVVAEMIHEAAQEVATIHARGGTCAQGDAFVKKKKKNDTNAQNFRIVNIEVNIVVR